MLLYELIFLGLPSIPGIALGSRTALEAPRKGLTQCGEVVVVGGRDRREAPSRRKKKKVLHNRLLFFFQESASSYILFYVAFRHFTCCQVF